MLISIFDMALSAARNRSDYEKRLRTQYYRLRQRAIWRLVREILLTGEEANERATLLCYLVAHGPAQSGIPRLQRIKYGSLCGFSDDLQFYFAAHVRQRLQMCWE